MEKCLQEGLGMVELSSAVKCCLYKRDLHLRKETCDLITKHQHLKYVKHLDEHKTAAAFDEKNILLLSMAMDQLHFRAVWQLEAQETLQLDGRMHSNKKAEIL